MRSLDSSKNFEAGLYIFFKFREITIIISCQCLKCQKVFLLVVVCTLIFVIDFS